MEIVDDLLSHVNRRAIVGQCLLDSDNCAVNPCAIPAGCGQEDSARSGNRGGGVHFFRRATLPGHRGHGYRYSCGGHISMLTAPAGRLGGGARLSAESQAVL